MKLTQESLIALARKNPLVTRLASWFSRSRSQKLVDLFEPFLPVGGLVLDIGCGIGHTSEAIDDRKFRVVACDIVDLRFVDLCFVLADGARLPFETASFDAALLITVLHHVSGQNHAAMLREAAQVLRPGGRLIILEDTYRSSFERWLTLFFDSAMNLEFFNHPHANRSLREWRELVESLNLHIVREQEFVAWYGFVRMRHALIVIERESVKLRD